MIHAKITKTGVELRTIDSWLKEYAELKHLSERAIGFLFFSGSAILSGKDGNIIHLYYFDILNKLMKQAKYENGWTIVKQIPYPSSPYKNSYNKNGILHIANYSNKSLTYGEVQ